MLGRTGSYGWMVTRAAAPIGRGRVVCWGVREAASRGEVWRRKRSSGPGMSYVTSSKVCTAERTSAEMGSAERAAAKMAAAGDMASSARMPSSIVSISRRRPDRIHAPGHAESEPRGKRILGEHDPSPFLTTTFFPRRIIGVQLSLGRLSASGVRLRVGLLTDPIVSSLLLVSSSREFCISRADRCPTGDSGRSFTVPVRNAPADARNAVRQGVSSWRRTTVNYPGFQRNWMPPEGYRENIR
jgi:hypothetical protein